MTDLETTSCYSRPRPVPSVVFCCALGLIASILPGCSTLGIGDKKKAADPILGEVHPQNTNPYGPTPPTEKEKPKTSTEQKSSANTAPDPLIGPSPTSNAYLAST